MENALHMEDDMMHAMQGVWHSFELRWHLKSGSASFKIVNLFKDTFSLQLFSQFILCNDPECDHTHPVPPLWSVPFDHFLYTPPLSSVTSRRI